MRLNEIKPVFCKFIPDNLEYGIVYIAEEWNSSTHLCACGCGNQAVLPLGNPNIGEFWILSKRNEAIVSFSPSVGNNHSSCPTNAHYFIIDNQIVWQ